MQYREYYVTINKASYGNLLVSFSNLLEQIFTFMRADTHKQLAFKELQQLKL